jgi:glycosyltransferase involved in cell wall biosynthesis
MRILHVIDTLGPGGTEHSLLHLLRVFRTRHEVEVCVLGPPYTLAESFESLGIPVHRLGFETPRDWPSALARLRRVTQRRFDVVRAHLFQATLAVALVTPRSALRVVSFHGLDYDAFPATTPARRIRKRLHEAIVHRYDGWVGISEAVARHFETELRLSRVQVVHNPFPIDELVPEKMRPAADVRAQFNVASDAFLLVMPARFSPEKGHDVLFAALRLLKDQGRLPRVLCFGHGVLRSAYAKNSEALGLSNVSSFDRIPQHEVYSVIHAADAVTLPTPLGEGFGRATAEAMALGKPVITARAGGSLDFVKHDQTGLLVRPNDAQDLACAIARLMDDAELRARLGNAAAKLVRTQFNVDIIVNRWEGYFGALLRERNKLC